MIFVFKFCAVLHGTKERSETGAGGSRMTGCASYWFPKPGTPRISKSSLVHRKDHIRVFKNLKITRAWMSNGGLFSGFPPRRHAGCPAMDAPAVILDCLPGSMSTRCKPAFRSEAGCCSWHSTLLRQRCVEGCLRQTVSMCH